MTYISLNETFSSEGPQCPYCGSQFTADEGFFYDESQYVEDECSDCGKKFKVEVNNSTSWTCMKIEEGEINE